MQLANEYTRDFNLGALPGEVAVPAGSNKSTVFPQFFLMAVKDETKSLATGRPAHREIEMVQIIIPGDKHNIVERRVREPDKIRWHRQYDAFKKGQEQAADGTRLEDWPVLNRAQILDLKSQNIFTVEAVAGLSDGQLGAIGMGARQLRRHAQAFLETCERGRVPAQLVAENEALKNKVDLLTSQMGDMLRKFEAFAAKSGEKIEDMANPVMEARIAAKGIVGASVEVDIPPTYAKLGLTGLKDLVAKFSTAVPRNKEDAIEIIEEYLGKRQALA